MDSRGFWRFITSSKKDVDVLRSQIPLALSDRIDPAKFVLSPIGEIVPVDGSEWVELFVREMLNASGMDDARARASGVLEVLEKSTMSRAGVVVADNSILKRTVTIQHDHQKEAELIGPALKGTLNVLGSCAKASSVRRVVVTSSFVAVAYNGRPLTSDVKIDETWFSDAKYCTEVQDWYSLSKTLAEEAAWKFASENSIDIVTINPAMVIGPLLQPTLNTSAASILSLINATTFPNATYGWVNVKNVVEAHILAFEVPSASGRYCLVESAVHFSELVKILKECFPDYNLPEKCADEKPFNPVFHVSKDKAEKLGINFIPLEVSLKETVESLKAKNFIKF